MKRTYVERFLRSREITQDMMEGRGYAPDYTLESTSEGEERMKEICEDIQLTHILEPYIDELVQTYTKSGSVPIPKVWVMWMGDLGVGHVYNIYQKIKTESIKHLIIVIDSKITCKARETLQNIKKVDHLKLEIFYESYLQYNPTNHDLVPTHRICSTREKQRILFAYGVKPHQVPKIRSEDPVAKFIGATKGKMVEIKIRRENPYSDEFLESLPESKRYKIYYDITYRLVV